MTFGSDLESLDGLSVPGISVGVLGLIPCFLFGVFVWNAGKTQLSEQQSINSIISAVMRLFGPSLSVSLPLLYT